MAISTEKSMLSGIKVCSAIRRQVGMLPGSYRISQGIAYLIKYKANAFLVLDDMPQSVGVVTKTDLMLAYYAGLSLDQYLSDIMIAPPVFFGENDRLETVLEFMQEKEIHQVFVKTEDGAVSGMLSYTDFVGMMYRYCRNCRHNLHFRGTSDLDDAPVRRFRVNELMSERILNFQLYDCLSDIMEGLGSNRFWATLIADAENNARGVISKSDLILAYKHGLSPETPAETIMAPRIHSCPATTYLTEAIRQMIFSDVQRLFVFREDPRRMIGVLSLTDAARARSGSCKACRTSRVKIDPNVL